MKLRATLVWWYIAAGCYTQAQPALYPEVLTHEGKALSLAWAGGLNAPQIQKMDLNGDGTEDLVVFERTAYRVFSFLALADKRIWQYAPQYEAMFPANIQGWLMLRDYDGDGRKDIFAHAPEGIQVWRNLTPPGSQELKWAASSHILYTIGFNNRLVNLQVNVIDIPLIKDMDNDGDLDILTYDFSTGSYIEYHQNMSKERFGTADSLVYKRVSNCWGGLVEGTECGDFQFRSDCDGDASGGGEIMTHVGSVLQILDTDHDQREDLLVSDVNCAALYRFRNKGSNTKPRFMEWDTLFPASKPIRFTLFPALFLEDVDFDHKPDLLAAPNVFANQRYGDKIDFRHSLWYYRQERKGKKSEYIFVEDNFLQKDMLDVGEHAYPLWYDADQDGDLDLIVGNRAAIQDDNRREYRPQLYYLENVGKPAEPRFVQHLLPPRAFVLPDSLHDARDVKPFAQDIDGDGVPELGFSLTRQHYTTIYYWQGSTLRRHPLSLQARDYPLFYDADADGDVDILVGRGAGGLSYYAQQGTTQSPKYVLLTDSLGGIKAHSFRRDLHLSLADIDRDGRLDLITGSGDGQVRIYADIARLFGQKTWRSTILPQRFGLYTYPAAADLNGDGFAEIVVGLGTGGLQWIWGQ